MKKYIILIAVAFPSYKGYSQKVKIVHKNKKVAYCKLPIDTANVDYSFGTADGVPITYYYKDGSFCEDTTGLAEFKRRKQIGDTDIYEANIDTTKVILLTKVGNIKLHTTVLKVTDNGEMMHWSLYEDTLTKRHFIGNFGYGNVRSSSVVNPFKYLTLDKKELPKDMFIYGEINNNGIQ